MHHMLPTPGVYRHLLL